MAINGIGLPPQAVAQQVGQQNIPQQEQALLNATVQAAQDIGMRFHVTRGSMSLGRSKGGLPPDHVVQEEDQILADCQRVIGAGLRAGTLGAWAPAMGVAAGLSVGIIFALVYRIEALLPADRSAVPSAGGFDADDVLFAVGPIAWLGWLQPFLAVAAVGAPIATLITLAIWLRLRRRPRDGGGQRSNTLVGSE